MNMLLWRKLFLLALRDNLICHIFSAPLRSQVNLALTGLQLTHLTNLRSFHMAVVAVLAADLLHPDLLKVHAIPVASVVIFPLLARRSDMVPAMLELVTLAIIMMTVVFHIILTSTVMFVVT